MEAESNLQSFVDSHYHIHSPSSDFSLTPPVIFREHNHEDIVEAENEDSAPYSRKRDPDQDSSIAIGSNFNSNSLLLLLPNFDSKKNKFYRCKTAPAMAVMRENLNSNSNDPCSKPAQSDSGSLVRQAALLLVIYLSVGVVIYSFNRDHFSGLETHPVVDALYFSIVTMCTIGYGDIAPVTPSAKLFACFFVLVGFGFIDILLSGVVNYVLDLQETMILNGINMTQQTENNNKNRGGGGGGGGGVVERRFSPKNCIFDFAKGRMRIRLKVGLALGVVLLSIGMGTLVLYFVENLDWIDSLYLSVMSVTTVGYGDRAFTTVGGRLFASIWLLFSTLTVARAFLYLAEARIDKRHRRITNWVLHRRITVDDLLAADINNNGFLSKLEYIVFKLKEMGKIGEKDILQICNQFNKLDHNNCGKITLPHLLAGRFCQRETEN